MHAELDVSSAVFDSMFNLSACACWSRGTLNTHSDHTRLNADRSLFCSLIGSAMAIHTQRSAFEFVLDLLSRKLSTDKGHSAAPRFVAFIA